MVKSWKIILATMVIFGAGVVTGGLVAHLVGVGTRPPRLAARNPGQTRTEKLSVAGGQRLEFLRRAQRELALTQEQRERIDKLLKESQERTRKVLEPVTPELRREMEQTTKEFVEILTPEQRERFGRFPKPASKQVHSRDLHRPQAPREAVAETALTNTISSNSLSTNIISTNSAGP